MPSPIEFKPWGKIPRFDDVRMRITQKMHGTNAQIVIENDVDAGVMRIKAGSRTRYLTQENDNYGFARFVHDNAEDLIEILNEGTHYGEWCGPGINSGEGLKEKTLFLFNVPKFRHFIEHREHPQVSCVPILYEGPFSTDIIDQVFKWLKREGSHAVEPGTFDRVEGIVIEVAGKRFKKVFDVDDTGWAKSSTKTAIPAEVPADVSCLGSLARLENVLSKDSRLSEEFPKTFAQIIKMYYTDLIEDGLLKEEEKEKKKALSKFLPTMIKHHFSYKTWDENNF